MENDYKFETREFKVLFNGTKDVETKLRSFKEECATHNKLVRRKRKHCKRRFYNLGLMAKIVTDTTEDELHRLLKVGTRTFHIDTVTNKQHEFEQILLRTNNAIAQYQQEQPLIRVVTGLACEIRGDCCRTGRFRNNISVLVEEGDVITLTVDEAYQYSCFKQITYVINLRYYIGSLKLNDEISIGKEIRARIIKVLKTTLAICILNTGLLSSYDYIELPNQCYSLQPENFADLFTEDLDKVARANADYVIVPKIRCKPFMTMMCNCIKENYSFKIIGALDLEFISAKMLDVIGLIKLVDYVWIPDLFYLDVPIKNYIYEDIVPMCRCLKKPIIGTIPLQRCSDFKHFENHEFLWKIDAIFIEKSAWCNRYPLIVKRLLPIVDYRMGVVENEVTLRNILTSYQSIVNFIIRTISTVECMCIFLHSRCAGAALELSRTEIYCPVYVMIPMDDEETEACKIDMVRKFNLRRNLRAIMYTKEMNECEYNPIEYGVNCIRKTGAIDTGDFIITIDVGKEEEDGEVSYGVDDDVALLRAFFLPPPPIAEEFKYA